MVKMIAESWVDLFHSTTHASSSFSRKLINEIVVLQTRRKNHVIFTAEPRNIEIKIGRKSFEPYFVKDHCTRFFFT